MAADQYLNPDQFGPLYHGTSADLSEGDHIEPGHPGNYVRRMKHAYMTTDLERAKTYAGNSRSPGLRPGPPRVYQVEPTGAYGHRRDARKRDNQFASEEPLKIIREVWRREERGQ